jgi:hypothetical protein
MKRLLLFLVLAGCTSAQTITGPDGTPHKLITCQMIESCYAEASNLCGGKYKIVNSSTHTALGDNLGTDLLVKCEGRPIESSIP